MNELTDGEVTIILRALEYAEEELASAECDGWTLSTGVMQEIEEAKSILTSVVEYKAEQELKEIEKELGEEQ